MAPPSTRAKAAATATVGVAGAAAYEAYRRGWFTKAASVLRNVVETTQDTAEVREREREEKKRNNNIPRSLRRDLTP